MALSNIKWFIAVSFKTELFSEYIIQHGYQFMGKILGIPFSFQHRKNVDNDICIDLEEHTQFQRLVKTDYKRILPHFFKVIEEVSKEFIEFGEKLQTKNLKGISNDELAKTFSQYCALYEKVAGLIGVPAPCEFVLTDILKEKLEQHLGSKNLTFEQFLAIISFCDRETKTFQERMDLLRLSIRMQNGGDISKDVEKHSTKYIWITKTLFLGEDYTSETIIKEIKAEIKKNPKKRITKIKSDKEREVKQFKEITSGVSDDAKKDIKLFQELIFFRNARLEWLNEGCHNGCSLLNEIAKRLDLTFEELIYLMPFEIENILNKKSKVDKNEIQRRLKKYALVMENGKITLYTGNEVDPHKVNVKVTVTNELTGTCASQGKVIGKVKIIKDRSELHKVVKGDILITRLTTPDFVMAMEKAAAIVTDIGGLTSHAAIVSRELGVPCLVGTETATQVFKDGDLVEVDATNGKVRKVKSTGLHISK